MRTITLTKTIYSFDELSETAKEKAVNEIINRYGRWQFESECDDFRNTLEQMEINLHINVYGWEVNGKSQYNYKFEFNDYLYRVWGCNDYDDNPKYLVRFLNNEVFPMIKGKYYGKLYRNADNTEWVHKKRYSHIIKENGCLLTGVCTDRAYDNAVNNAFEYVRRGYTIKDFIDLILDDFFSEWGAQMEYYYSEEYARDIVDEMDLEFYEDGTFYGEA